MSSGFNDSSTNAKPVLIVAWFYKTTTKQFSICAVHWECLLYFTFLNLKLGSKQDAEDANLYLNIGKYKTF